MYVWCVSLMEFVSEKSSLCSGLVSLPRHLRACVGQLLVLVHQCMELSLLCKLHNKERGEEKLTL